MLQKFLLLILSCATLGVAALEERRLEEMRVQLYTAQENERFLTEAMDAMQVLLGEHYSNMLALGTSDPSLEDYSDLIMRAGEISGIFYEE